MSLRSRCVVPCGFAILLEVSLPQFQPIALGRKTEPFSHPDWLFEVKWDGFRSLAYVHDGECRLLSRKGNQFKSFPALNEAIAAELGARSAILDGEIVCKVGKPNSKTCYFAVASPASAPSTCSGLTAKTCATCL